VLDTASSDYDDGVEERRKLRRKVANEVVGEEAAVAAGRNAWVGAW
jgi:hypothetical protein